MSSTPISFSLSFLHKEQLAKDTYSFFFDRSQSDFDFRPGQYIRMTLPHANPDVRGTSRFFTIASSPLQKDVLMITAKVIQSSFKETLLNLPPGKEVQLFGPMGHFSFQETDKRHHVFLSGGMGITPFHSMLRYAAEKKLSLPMTLIASFGSTDELLFYDELMDSAKNHKNIQVIYTITQLNDIEKWLGESGRISEELIKKYVPAISESLYYVVGPSQLVEGTKEVLQDMRIDDEQIFSEDFTGY